MMKTLSAHSQSKQRRGMLHRAIIITVALSGLHCGRTDISSCEPPTVVPFRRLARTECYSSKDLGGEVIRTKEDAEMNCNGYAMIDVDFRSEFVIGYSTISVQTCVDSAPMIDTISTGDCAAAVKVHAPSQDDLGPCNAIVEVSDFVAVPRKGIVELPIEFSGP